MTHDRTHCSECNCCISEAITFLKEDSSAARLKQPSHEVLAFSLERMKCYIIFGTLSQTSNDVVISVEYFQDSTSLLGLLGSGWKNRFCSRLLHVGQERILLPTSTGLTFSQQAQELNCAGSSVTGPLLSTLYLKWKKCHPR